MKIVYLIKKYVLLMVVARLVIRLLEGLVVTVNIHYSSVVGSTYFIYIIHYLINLLFVFLLLDDMKRIGIRWTPLVMLAFFSHITAVPLFLLGAAFQKINLKTNTYE